MLLAARTRFAGMENPPALQRAAGQYRLTIMHRLLSLLFLASSAYAGVVQGVVVEHASGRPVARTIVRLDPVPVAGRDPAKPVIVRAGRAGQFVFSSVAAGLYLLTAVRDGYFPASYGQRRPVGRGTPFQVTADSSMFAELRLRQKGAITGRVLDENGVAAPRVNVLAYRARLPLRSADGAISDDRGVYRIHGLEPGKYWVRSGTHALDDGTGWQPTFGPQGRELKDARVHTVTADADTAYADVSPEPGLLFRLGGLITCETAGTVLITVSSESGQRNAQTYCGPTPGSFRFDGMAPGLYEVFAVAQDGGASGFLELHLGGNLDGVNISLMKTPPVTVEVRRSGSRAPAEVPVRVTGRRQNLSATGTEVEVISRRTSLSPGYWEFRAEAPAGYFIESISTSGGDGRRRGTSDRPPDRFQSFVEARYQSAIWITVSDQVATFSGRVLADSKPVPGAPVFLWPVTDAARRSLGGALQTITNTDGQYRLEDLPPGDYRLLASFDVYEFDEELVQLSEAPLVTVGAMRTVERDLTLWLAPY